MSPTTQSLIRHILTALGFVLGLVGLNKFTGVLDIVTQNLDGLMASISTVAGVVMAIVGFFKNKARLKQGAAMVIVLLAANSMYAAPAHEFRTRTGDCMSIAVHWYITLQINAYQFNHHEKHDFANSDPADLQHYRQPNITGSRKTFHRSGFAVFYPFAQRESGVPAYNSESVPLLE